MYLGVDKTGSLLISETFKGSNVWDSFCAKNSASNREKRWYQKASCRIYNFSQNTLEMNNTKNKTRIWHTYRSLYNNIFFLKTEYYTGKERFKD